MRESLPLRFLGAPSPTATRRRGKETKKAEQPSGVCRSGEDGKGTVLATRRLFADAEAVLAGSPALESAEAGRRPCGPREKARWQTRRVGLKGRLPAPRERQRRGR